MDMKKFLQINMVTTIASTLLTVGQVYASEVHTNTGSFAGNATPTSYILRISAVEFHKVGDDSSTYQPFVSTPADWDIASASAGANIGTMQGSSPLAAGSYDKIRFTVSKTMTITGAISSLSGGAPCRTEGDGQTVSNPFGAGVIDTAYLGARDGGAAEAETVTVPTGSSATPPSDFTDLGTSFRGVLTLAEPFTVSAGTLPTIKLKFDVTNAIQFVLLPDLTGRCVVFPGPPSLAVSVT